MELMTIRQVMSEFSITSQQTVYNWIDRGWLKKIKIGGLVRFDRKEIEKLKEGRQYDDQ